MGAKGVKVGLYLSGQDVLVEDCNIALTQPKIKDIVLFGEDEFLIGTQLLAHTDKMLKQVREGNSQLENFSDFQLLLVILREEPAIKKSIMGFLEFIFPQYEIKIEENFIDFYVQEEEEKKFVGGRITPFNFAKLQQTISDVFEFSDPNQEEYNPANDAAAEIAKKLQRGRERKQQMQAGKEGPQSMFGRYTSILSVGLQMDINIFYNYTPFQLYDIFQRYFSKVSSDLYTKISTTPLMDVSNMEQPKDWSRNLY
jgi:hypothetical protein